MATSKLQKAVSRYLSTWYGGYTIRENYRPNWLSRGNGSNLELDFYIEEMNEVAKRTSCKTECKKAKRKIKLFKSIINKHYAEYAKAFRQFVAPIIIKQLIEEQEKCFQCSEPIEIKRNLSNEIVKYCSSECRTKAKKKRYRQRRRMVDDEIGRKYLTNYKKYGIEASEKG